MKPTAPHLNQRLAHLGRLAVVVGWLAGSPAGAIPIRLEEVPRGWDDCLNLGFANQLALSENYPGEASVMDLTGLSFSPSPAENAASLANPEASFTTPANPGATPASTTGVIATGPALAATIEQLSTQNETPASKRDVVAAKLQKAIWTAIAVSAGGAVTAVQYESQLNPLLVDTISFHGGQPPGLKWSDNYNQHYLGVPDAASTIELLGGSLSVMALVHRKYFRRPRK